MRVSGTPQRPKPPARRVVLLFIISSAAEAEGRILLISFRGRVVEKVRIWREDWEEWSALPTSTKSVEPTGRRIVAARRLRALWETIMAI